MILYQKIHDISNVCVIAALYINGEMHKCQISIMQTKQKCCCLRSTNDLACWQEIQPKHYFSTQCSVYIITIKVFCKCYFHSYQKIKAKETKKCHHRQLMSADAVEFCQLGRMRTSLCYGRSADAADWAVT
jgi:hypothetical protein